MLEHRKISSSSLRRYGLSSFQQRRKPLRGCFMIQLTFIAALIAAIPTVAFKTIPRTHPQRQLRNRLIHQSTRPRQSPSHRRPGDSCTNRYSRFGTKSKSSQSTLPLQLPSPWHSPTANRISLVGAPFFPYFVKDSYKDANLALTSGGCAVK